MNPFNELPLRIDVDLADHFSFVAWQNEVPPLRRLTIRFDGGAADAVPIDDLMVRMTCDPPLLLPRDWVLRRIEPGQRLDVSPLEVDCEPSALGTLNEAVRVRLRFNASVGEGRGRELGRQSADLRVLASNQWGGADLGPNDRSGELIAAFVQPSDPAIASVLRDAAAALKRHGHCPAMDGYQSGDADRAYLIAASLWSAVAGRGLTYAMPPASFERSGQKIRTPGEVLGSRLATCLDTTVLLAAAAEAAGLHPVILFKSGHAWLGIWTIDRTMATGVIDDPAEIRKAIGGHEMIAIETTMATGNVAGFEAAVAAGRKAIDSSGDDKFLAAYDIHRARLAKIRPLASTAARIDEPNANAPTELPLPAAPKLRPTVQDDSEPAPTTPAGRIQRWQRKLLDLSLHNRLINHKPAATVIPLVQPDGAAIEDQLSGGKRLRLVPPDEATSVGGRGGNESADADLSRQFAAEALRRGELVIDVPASELDRRLTRLRRDVKRDLEEGGNNTLFLAIGFLRWKRPDEDRTLLAPLILVPLSLTKRTSLSQYHVEAGDDDIRINQTLLQLLAQDFECSLHHLADRLPVDSSGVDVDDLLRRFADGVRDLPGLEVVSGAAIATYSFSKYLMWRDLVDQTDTLRQNRVVSRLIDGVTGKDGCDDSGGVMIGAEQVDKIDPATLVLPLPADSSQTAAVAAAAAGRDFVLIGPPGTGKSQTITNIIAGCLADGKTVLFVAEKTAALEVVHRRLMQVGLGQCCVELHSRKADRRSFLNQIKTACPGPRPPRCPSIAARLRHHPPPRAAA